MDSLKIFKGYDKVETNLEDQQTQQQHRHEISKPLIATISIIIITIFFLTLTLSFTLFFHHTDSQTPLKSANSIRSICNVTRFPDSCFTALSPSSENLTNPNSILKLSILASVAELSKLNLASSLKADSDKRALDDCKELINNAVSRLNESVSTVPDGAVTLTEGKIKDIQTWVSAALTDQQTCVDGIEEVGVSLDTLEKVKKMMQKSNEYTSNSLAIVANINNLLPIH
ncbi:putative pectinesterase/pectinesterase inhibitor 26 [Vicia villosa]|uniref:putative pectinesterase/pectinesterase inhibitor 26 n=1 Tax=Vicia villosa TaxID=3911 RepID=UPI00273AAFD3|nr:putative pectinesterase/pectinesterase inhibitor 26 [Vicia villosa]